MIEKLQYITQEGRNGESHAEMVRRACEIGVKWVQLRIKEAPLKYIHEQAVEALQICRTHGARLIINDRVALCKEIDADGVHIGKEDMDPREARRILGTDKLIGCTSNTFEDIQQLALMEPDYIGLGPYRFTKTKDNLSPILGIEGYQKILEQMNANNIRIPVVAIGGIAQEDVQLLMDSGVFGVAVGSAISFSEDPQQIVRNFNEALTNGEVNNS